jgi:hypothetical protein
MGQIERSRYRLAREMLKAGGSIDDAPVKEHPAIRDRGGGPVGKSHFEYASHKGCFVGPGDSQTPIPYLFLDDPPPRLLHNRVAASMKLRQQ